VVSFLPSEGREGKLLLTGEVNLLLNNLFHAGKTLALQWQKLQVLSQQLMVHYDHTNLLKSPIDVSLHFDFLKEDTLFVNRDFRTEISFRKNAHTKIGVFANLRSSRLLDAQEASSSPAIALDYADYNLTNYGIKYTWEKLDHHLFPKRGIAVAWEASAGNKKLRNTQMPDKRDISVNSWQYTFLGTFSYYHTMSKNLMLYHRLQGGTLQNEHLFYNDLWRIGGLHSLRGFNEKFFFAASYALSNLELRLLFDRQQEEYSYLFLFYDQTYMVREAYCDYPLGIGAGISLVTNSGIFNLAYALGNAKGQSMDLSVSKIHFGYIGRF
jgi:outer membrane protein assembly factor BamA